MPTAIGRLLILISGPGVYFVKLISVRHACLLPTSGCGAGCQRHDAITGLRHGPTPRGHEQGPRRVFFDNSLSTSSTVLSGSASRVPSISSKRGRSDDGTCEHQPCRLTRRERCTVRLQHRVQTIRQLEQLVQQSDGVERFAYVERTDVRPVQMHVFVDASAGKSRPTGRPPGAHATNLAATPANRSRPAPHVPMSDDACPQIRSTNVLLPEPGGPTRATDSPGANRRFEVLENRVGAKLVRDVLHVDGRRCSVPQVE